MWLPRRSWRSLCSERSSTDARIRTRSFRPLPQTGPRREREAASSARRWHGPDPVFQNAGLRSRLPHQAIDLLALGSEVSRVLRHLVARDGHDHGVRVVIVDVEGDRRHALEVVVDPVARLERDALLVYGVGSDLNAGSASRPVEPIIVAGTGRQ